MAQDVNVGREILPIPDQPYRGAVPFDARTADAPKQALLHAPKSAPNVVIVLVDDMGFGIPSAFGGCVNMPTTDRLAKGGLRYTHFHTTALCSPTRAALLTGRNHHSVNMGVITEFGTSWPGATGMIPNTCASIAQILKLNGYNTGQFGKCHEVPAWEQSISGPFDRWPTGAGFEKFYGFLGGEMDQFEPVLFDGTTRVDPPKKPEEGYHLSDDLTDKAIGWIREQQTSTPDRPFFAYVAYGATHAPHQVPDSFRGRHKGQFDKGWDKLREETLQRQKKAGVVPADAKLAGRPEGVNAWDELTADMIAAPCLRLSLVLRSTHASGDSSDRNRRPQGSASDGVHLRCGGLPEPRRTCARLCSRTRRVCSRMCASQANARWEGRRRAIARR